MGMIQELLLSPKAAEQAKLEATHLRTFTLSNRQLCDLELFLCGGFSPLVGFMTEKEYKNVLSSLRLPNGTVWPIPLPLDVPEEFAKETSEGEKIALYDKEGLLLAILTVSDIFELQKEKEAKAVYETMSLEHPGVAYILQKQHAFALGGKLTGVSLPAHYDFVGLRRTPREVRHAFQQMGWNKVVAFQTRNPMHRAHRELTFRAMESTGANLFIHPVIGMTKPGDLDAYTRVRCYEKILETYPKEKVFLSLLPLAMRMAGPREAVWHAIIRKNYGCDFFIVGRDHAGPGKDKSGKEFYKPYAAQELLQSVSAEIGITVVAMQEMVYVEEEARYFPVNEVPKGQTALSISGTELRRRLLDDEEIPEWFSYPSIIEELRKSVPSRSKRGIAIFFTGLSGSGKTTIARRLYSRLLEECDRPVTLLDGDFVRKHLTSELGFSKEHRDLNILRIGFVASEIVKHRGIAICAAIAPYASIRQQNRECIDEYGDYIEIYVSTPLEVCETRDRKGLYKKARAGLIKNFTGIDDPYEPPENPHITIDTTRSTPEQEVEMVLSYLREKGYIAPCMKKTVSPQYRNDIKKVMVTGGAGCIGLEVCKELRKRGLQVYLFDLPEQIIRAQKMIPEGSIICNGSILDRSSIRETMEQCDAVIHLAAYLGVRRTETNKLRCFEINVDGTRNILESAVQHRIKKIVFASSSEVYGDPLENPVTEKTPVHGKTVYAVTKLMGEELFKAYSQRYPTLEYVILRYFNAYGSNQIAQFVIPRFISDVLHNQSPQINGDGRQRRSYCYASDTAWATVEALLKRNTHGETINVGNSEEVVNITELAERIITLAGKEGKIVPKYNADFSNTDRDRNREIIDRYCDTRKARSLLNFTPRVTLNEGLKQVIEAESLAERWEATEFHY